MSTIADAGPTKAVAKVALLGVDESSAAVLTECFSQFGIQVSMVPDHESGKVAAAYNACVVPLNGKAEAALREIRRASHRTVVYGMCGSVSEALPFSKWGINAVFHTPVGKQEALLVVRATHLLVMQELRRYTRVPLVCSVKLETGTQVLPASSLEISAGGMSLTTNSPLTVPQTVLVTFGLPDVGMISVRSVVCWTRPEEGSVAIRFDPGDKRRAAVRNWIDDYLGA